MIAMTRNPPTTHPEKNIKILVVEDEKIIAINLKENLESLGYAVVAIADSGEQAVEKASKYHPDLVLMDIRLKGNIDGISAAQEIWEHLSIPVIYVTGHSDQSTLERAKMTAPFGYILKPVKERELSVVIEIALQRYQREHLLSAILRGMADGVIVVDTEYRINFLNRMAELLTGWQLFEARDREITEVFKLVDEQTHQPIDSPVRTVIESDTTVYLEDQLMLITKNGRVIPISDSIAPIKDNNGAITGAVLVFRDISDVYDKLRLRQCMEATIRQQLEKEQKLNQLQHQILQTFSHEYRTPLAIILACSQLLENNDISYSVDKLHRNCQRIQQSVKYMVRLLDDISIFNRAEVGQLEFYPSILDLKNFCRQLISEYKLANSSQHKIKLSTIGKAYLASVDQKLIQQILGNLLSNALKYSPAKSKISLVIIYKSEQIIFQVQDQGIGIPLEDQLHIFEPFRRGANVDTIRGIGMGLAIVKRAVDLHQGTLSFESIVGVGTTFTVTLPRSRE